MVILFGLPPLADDVLLARQPGLLNRLRTAQPIAHVNTGFYQGLRANRSGGPCPGRTLTAKNLRYKMRPFLKFEAFSYAAELAGFSRCGPIPRAPKTSAPLRDPSVSSPASLIYWVRAFDSDACERGEPYTSNFLRKPMPRKETAQRSGTVRVPSSARYRMSVFTRSCGSRPLRLRARRKRYTAW
jgi:hypothetical protein